MSVYEPDKSKRGRKLPLAANRIYRILLLSYSDDAFLPKDFNRLKIIAYTSPDGDEWVTALEAKLKHREGMIYYSRHRPGTRKKMVLTRRKATNFSLLQ